MKNLRYLLPLPLLLLLPVVTGAAEIKRVKAPSRITAVTVYADRAQTSRSASLNLRPGSYLVAFDNLTPLIQDDSVRVEGKGNGITIAGLEIKRTFLEQSGEKRVKEIDDEIRDQERRLGGLDAKKAGLSSQKAFLETIRVAWSERISKELAIGRPTAAELMDAASFVGAGVTKAEEQALAVEAERRIIKAKIDALRRQREQASGTHRKETKTVEVMLEVAREGALTLTLSAVIPQAGWTPTYDVRLAADGTSAELTFRALVHQQTGEDWENVELNLSTARPAAGSAPPELAPWRVDFFRPQPPPMPVAAAPMPLRSKMAKAERVYLEEAMDAREAPAVQETAQFSEETSSVSFHTPRPLDIPSDGSQHGTVVAVEQLPVTLEFQAVPKLSPAVFLKSEIVNRAPYPLLPGKVNTFSGGTFTGSAPMKKVASGEKFDLFFGSDDQVTVKREELKQHKEAGMFGKNRASYRYRIDLANYRKQPVTVTLRDQLPVAGDEDIKISLDDPSQKPDESGSDGRLVWKLPLAAGEKRELSFGIVVEYPKDRELTGL